MRLENVGLENAASNCRTGKCVFHFGLAFSSLAFSSLAVLCRVFQPRVFQSLVFSPPPSIGLRS